MPAYFLSDVHLRLDQPGRGRRLAKLVDRLSAADSLTIVGDLCDFWYGTRQYRADPMTCPGLRSLASFRERGGPITVLAGNHDAWLGPFYEKTFGAKFVPNSMVVEEQGLRMLVAHGHRLGAETRWKSALKSRPFFEAFRRVPSPLADALGGLLRDTNSRNQEAFDRRGLATYRAFASGVDPSHDLVILGHVHLPLDTAPSRPRLVVLGGWHARNCYLAVEGGEAVHVAEPAEP